MSALREQELGIREPVNILVDGIEISCLPGSTVLEACRQAEIRIPTLCHDPRVEAHGGCRLCIVEIDGVSGFPTSCTTTVKPGMRITTHSETLHRLRSTVVELLLSDHDSACLTCHSNGACALQDLAYEFRVDGSRYAGAKHESAVDNSDALISRDMAKCVKCGLCARVCDQLQGASVYGTRGRGFDALPDTALSLPLKESGCEFCGQCVSVCPVGALTDRLSHFLARPWEIETIRTTCGYCGVGCTIGLQVAGGVIVGADASADHGVNRGALCAKGRYGWRFHRHSDRLTKPLVRKDGKLKEVEWGEAIAYTADRLTDIVDKHGPAAVCALASAKCTTEESYLFQRFMREVIGTANIDHCARL